MIDSRRLSATLPSTDPVDLRDSLAAAEERIARKTRAAVRRIVVGAYSRWLDTLTAAGDMGSFDGIPGEWEQFVNGELADDIGGVFDTGALSTWATLPDVVQAVGSLADGWMTVVNESATAYQMQATNRLRGVGETMWNDVKQIVARGVQAGENTEELKERIERVTAFSEYRADTIARTETIAAYNGGNAASAEALGDFGPTEKVWLAGIDARTRPTHVEANGQTVPFSSPFIVGGVEMQRPHDPTAPAREVVSCRCIMQVLYPGDLRPDGTVVPERGSVPEVSEAEGITEPFVVEPEIKPAIAAPERDVIRPIPEAQHDFEFFEKRVSEGLYDEVVGDRDIYSVVDHNDALLRAIIREQGFNAKPNIVSAGRFNELADEGWTIVYRGINAETEDDLARYIANFLDEDDFYVGRGVYGNGVYTSDIYETALEYSQTAGLGIGEQASGQAASGRVLNIAISPEANIVNVEDIRKEWSKRLQRIRERGSALYDELPTREVPHPYLDGETMIEKIPVDDIRPGDPFYGIAQEFKSNMQMQNLLDAIDDVGKFAAMEGVDVIEVTDIRTFNAQFQIVELPDTYYVILNRGAIAVQEAL